MKKNFLLTGLLISTFAYADVDYSRCMMASGIFQGSIDNDGKVQPAMGAKIKSIKTEGNKETIVFENMGYNGTPFTTEAAFERDDQGRIVKIISGGEKVDNRSLKNYKDMMVAMSVSGVQMQGVMAFEPNFWVDGKAVPLSKLTAEQAKKANYPGNIGEIQKLKTQWRKDKRVVKKLKDGYSEIMDKGNFVMPLGSETEFEIKDGVCLVKNSASRSYVASTKAIIKTPGITREACEKIQAVNKKYAVKLNECAEVQRNVYMESLPTTGAVAAGYGMGMTGGYAGGYVTGISMAGGYAGGMVGGYPGGVGGGFPGGMGGYMIPNAYQCESLYGISSIESQAGTSTVAPASNATKQ